MNFPILVRHPEHGCAYAYRPKDLEEFKGRGFLPDEPIAEALEESPKRRGRPPKADK